MPNRSNTIFDSVTDLTGAFQFRDILITELTQARWSGFEDAIRSQFKDEHFHNMDLLADLVATEANIPDPIHTMLRSANTPLDFLYAINDSRDRLEGVGDFLDAGDFTLETNWGIGITNGVGHAISSVAPGAFHNIIHSVTLPSDTRFLFEFTVTNYVSGAVNPRIFGTENLNGPGFSADGAVSTVMSSGADPTSVALGVADSGGFTGRIENWSVRLIQ